MANYFSAETISVCGLTEEAMHALAEVAARLERRDIDELSELERRAFIWARCSLAALYGIRIDDMMSDVTVPDPGPMG